MMDDLTEFSSQKYYTSADAFDAAVFLEKLIDTFVSNQNFRDMVVDMWDQFTVAPASSRISFHGCFKGGLLVHSVNLTLHMIKSVVSDYDNDKIRSVSPESIVIAGIGHDFGKAGLKGIPYYVPEESEWHRNKLGRLYNRNDKLGYFEEVDVTLYQFMKYSVILTLEEYQAIRYQNLAYEDGFKSSRVNNNLFPITLILHESDMFSSRVCGT